jgi:hypothetical protein
VTKDVPVVATLRPSTCDGLGYCAARAVPQ